MITLHLFILILALVSLLMATANAPGLPRIHWGWLGMFLWLLSTMVSM